MAAQQSDEGPEDPDLARLREKSKAGVIAVVNDALQDPRIMNPIKAVILKESIVNGLVMAGMFIGGMTLFNSVKIMLNLNWMADVVFGSVLFFPSTFYMLKSLLKTKPKR